MFSLIPRNHQDSSLFRFFDPFGRGFFDSPMSSPRPMSVDIADQGDKYLLTAELPGVKKEDIQIDVENDLLVISAKHDQQTEEKTDSYVRRERTFGSFSRSFDLSDIQADGIQASYNDGVLTLDLPKKNPEQLPPSRQIQIQ